MSSLLMLADEIQANLDAMGKKGSIFNENLQHGFLHKKCGKITIESITAKNIFKKYPYIKKLWSRHFWSDDGYIKAVLDGITPDNIMSMLKRKTPKEKMKVASK